MAAEDDGVIDRLKNHVRDGLRNWILTDAEREVVSRQEKLEGEVGDVRQEWSELHRALRDADVIDDGAVVENADILVLTGSQHVVRGSDFGGKLYINGRGHTVSNCSWRIEEDE